MSYPTSGGAHLLNLIGDITKKTTGTNYGNVLKDRNGALIKNTYASLPIWSYRPNGPFKIADSDELPANYIPISTHCGATCLDCHPQYYLLPKYVFAVHCVTGTKFTPFNMGVTKHLKYNPDLVKKAIQLVRPPLNNVVGRFMKLYKEKQAMEDEVWLDEFPASKDGFHRWCGMQNEKFESEESMIWHSDVFEAAQGVPCRAEFYRYILWHNNAYETREIMGMPMKLVHTIDLQENYEATMTDILDFYQMTPVKNVTDYDGSDMNLEGYSSFYTLDMRKKIACFMRYVASPATRHRLGRYFTDCDL